MGKRNCAIQGCNSLEFRTSKFCLRHKDGKPEENLVFSSRSSEEMLTTTVCILVSLPFLFWGLILIFNDNTGIYELYSPIFGTLFLVIFSSLFFPSVIWKNTTYLLSDNDSEVET